MSRDEIINILGVLKAAYPAFYSKISKNQGDAVLKLWEIMFANETKEVVEAAVYECISTHTGYPPDVAAIKEIIRGIERTVRCEPTDQELWMQYRKAVCDCLYQEQRTYNALPEILKRFAGSPGGLREHALMDAEIFNSVIYSNFLKQVKVLHERDHFNAALPENVKRVIAGAAEKMTLADGGHHMTESENNDRRNYILDL
jgi:hypothetical protein